MTSRFPHIWMYELKTTQVPKAEGMKLVSLFRLNSNDYDSLPLRGCKCHPNTFPSSKHVLKAQPLSFFSFSKNIPFGHFSLVKISH